MPNLVNTYNKGSVSASNSMKEFFHCEVLLTHAL
jgi:hypothetical protein